MNNGSDDLALKQNIQDVQLAKELANRRCAFS